MVVVVVVRSETGFMALEQFILFIDDSGVHDPVRTAYLADHINAVLDARRAGVDVRGYFAWSLMDNLEWSSGWTMQFGIVRVDPDTSERTPKDSAHWYRGQLLSRKP